MDNNKLESLKSELSDLLKKYNVEIRFVCNDYSDTSGLCNDRIVVSDKTSNNILIDTGSWFLTSNNINE